MRRDFSHCGLLILLLSGIPCLTIAQQPAFSKQVLFPSFLSEGAAVADVNRDGQEDVLAGSYWFEAPHWKKHEIDSVKVYKSKDYSYSFMQFSSDVNADGWPDLIRIGYPGEAAGWYENPQNKGGHWKQHQLHHSVGNESPIMEDVDGDGRMDLICNDAVKQQVIWLSPPTKKTDSSWTVHIISDVAGRGTDRYIHGFGFGDMNNDGRKDVVFKEGWWEAPVDRKQSNWKFHPAALGEECAQMYIQDLDGDGDQDVITSSAHKYGMWWHEQVVQADTVAWLTHNFYNKISQTHGLMSADINGDGHPDLITGKRYYAHNGSDPGAEEPAMLYWFEYKPGKKPEWTPHQIDDQSGAGLNFIVRDINGDNRTDIVVSNKKGVYVFLQQKR